MTNNALKKALTELRSAGAQNIPSETEIEGAPNGKKWSGKKSSGDEWELVKNGPDSFNTRC